MVAEANPLLPPAAAVVAGLKPPLESLIQDGIETAEQGELATGQLGGSSEEHSQNQGHGDPPQALLHDRPDLVGTEWIDPLAELQASGPDPSQHLLLKFGERSIEILLADPPSLEALEAASQLGHR